MSIRKFLNLKMSKKWQTSVERMKSGITSRKYCRASERVECESLKKRIKENWERRREKDGNKGIEGGWRREKEVIVYRMKIETDKKCEETRRGK